MPFSGGGVFTLTPGYTATTGQTILPSQHNPPLEDIAAGLNLAFIRDGRAAATGNFSMGGNRITGLASAVDPGDAATKGQISSISGLRNVLINPFSINQRGVSGTVVLAAGAYGHDRWKAGAGGCTYTFSTSAGVTTISISAGSLQQVVEASSFLGRSGSYVLSWSGTALGRINGGTTGGSGYVTANLNAAANATVEFLTGTVSLPQLERDYVSDFSTRHIQEELYLSQRYFERISSRSPNSVFAIGQAASSTIAIGLGQYSVPKRVAPTIAAGGTGQVGVWSAGTSVILATTLIISNQAGCQYQWRSDVNGGLVAGDATALLGDLSGTTFINFDAEL